MAYKDSTSPGAPDPTAIPNEVRAETQQRFLTEVGDLVPDLVPAAQELLARISSPNWALEWGLAEWLGTAYHLPEPSRRRLLLSNVYLIAFARITDDLADGEARHPSSDIVLATTVHHLWLREYVRIFCSGATLQRFWRHVDAGFGAWMCATSAPTRTLSDRGAFLRISAAAACVAAGREDVLPVVIEALDDLLAGIIMLDDFFDWRHDLLASRDNSFVNYCAGTGRRARPADLNARRHRITRALYIDGAGDSFFAALHERLVRAEQASRAAQCAGLTEFIRWYDGEVAVCATWLAKRISACVQAFLEDPAQAIGAAREPRDPIGSTR